MGARDAYAAGTFCWVDLATTDVLAAKRFYSDLLGWEAPPGARYSHWVLGARDVAGVYPSQDGEAAWTSYVAVADANATAERAVALGGTLVEPAFDAGEEGRRALAADPVGARFALWEAGTHPGAQLVNDVGCWCSNQLQAPDPAPALPFYREMFGWELVEQEGSETPYWEVRNAGRDNGGILGGLDVPPAWVVYFHVTDADAAASAVEAGGGAVHFPPTTVGIGRLAVCADQQGAVFGIFAGRTDP